MNLHQSCDRPVYNTCTLLSCSFVKRRPGVNSKLKQCKDYLPILIVLFNKIILLTGPISTTPEMPTAADMQLAAAVGSKGTLYNTYNTSEINEYYLQVVHFQGSKSLFYYLDVIGNSMDKTYSMASYSKQPLCFSQYS